MSMEIWKDIAGYGGRYQVSSWGRVRSIQGNKVTILKPYRNDKGYLKVSLHKDSKNNKHRVNRLVALAFVDNPYNLPQVNHKDGNKENNSFTNLEWTTDEINKRHSSMLKKGITVL